MELMSWYSDWKFWSAVVAWLSFMMNILPWFLKKIRGTNLSLTAYPTISLSHKLGIANIQWHLRLENNGGRELDISSISLSIGDENQTFSIPGMTYYERSSADQSILAGFKLKPGELWQGFICFYERLTLDEQREYRSIENSTRQELKNNATLNNQPIISLKLLEKINSFYSRMFKFKSREHNVKICIKTKDDEDFFFSGYRFTLYESDISELISHTQRYTTGDGVTWHSDINTWLPIQVSKNNNHD